MTMATTIRGQRCIRRLPFTDIALCDKEERSD